MTSRTKVVKQNAPIAKKHSTDTTIIVAALNLKDWFIFSKYKVTPNKLIEFGRICEVMDHPLLIPSTFSQH